MQHACTFTEGLGNLIVLNDSFYSAPARLCDLDSVQNMSQA